MRTRRIGAGAAMAAGALAVASLAFAPSALAVSPDTATINADCGAFGSGSATLTATQDGTAATITVTSAVTAPIALSADSISSTLTLVNNTTGSTSTFSGNKNPAIAAGDPVTVGPLNGTVASGDSLEAYGGALQLTVFGITVTCTATGPQSPGPFVFD